MARGKIMPRSTQDRVEQSHREVEALAEEIRKARAFSPWSALLPFSLGAGFALALLLAGLLILRLL
jgi:hypothetical protein